MKPDGYDENQCGVDTDGGAAGGCLAGTMAGDFRRTWQGLDRGSETRSFIYGAEEAAGWRRAGCSASELDIAEHVVAIAAQKILKHRSSVPALWEAPVLLLLFPAFICIYVRLSGLHISATF